MLSSKCTFCFQQCDSNNVNEWTINNNLPCSDNNVRTKDDHCVTGICVGTFYNCPSCEAHDGSGCPIKPGYCLIQHRGQRTCFAKNQYKPGNPCQVGSDSKFTKSHLHGVKAVFENWLKRFRYFLTLIL